MASTPSKSPKDAAEPPIEDQKQPAHQLDPFLEGLLDAAAKPVLPPAPRKIAGSPQAAEPSARNSPTNFSVPNGVDDGEKAIPSLMDIIIPRGPRLALAHRPIRSRGRQRRNFTTNMGRRISFLPKQRRSLPGHGSEKTKKRREARQRAAAFRFFEHGVVEEQRGNGAPRQKVLPWHRQPAPQQKVLPWHRQPLGNIIQRISVAADVDDGDVDDGGVEFIRQQGPSGSGPVIMEEGEEEEKKDEMEMDDDWFEELDFDLE